MPEYNYPELPNQEMREKFDDVNPLRQADGRGVTYTAPRANPAQNTDPNPYAPSMMQTVPGKQVFGTGRQWFEMPQNLDINHREMHIKINEGLLYRSNLGTPRRESPARRVFAPSVTRPTNNAAKFVGNNKTGDVYGS